ncbi:hypothetical protein IWQ60_010333 [Tieghemiomyces parasiticus]|uniref:Uncharacterized protein n=1 Tax=Tieghemiomyces parasiticus TaxID=78921 RepID=A0A9W7ZRR9_9FUNG|nr:hypothetical protein IWQ60_010333 [Tieghemiomyces parasiticus]
MPLYRIAEAPSPPPPSRIEKLALLATDLKKVTNLTKKSPKIFPAVANEFSNLCVIVQSTEDVNTKFLLRLESRSHGLWVFSKPDEGRARKRKLPKDIAQRTCVAPDDSVNPRDLDPAGYRHGLFQNKAVPLYRMEKNLQLGDTGLTVRVNAVLGLDKGLEKNFRFDGVFGVARSGLENSPFTYSGLNEALERTLGPHYFHHFNVCAGYRRSDRPVVITPDTPVGELIMSTHALPAMVQAEPGRVGSFPVKSSATHFLSPGNSLKIYYGDHLVLSMDDVNVQFEVASRFIYLPEYQMDEFADQLSADEIQVPLYAIDQYKPDSKTPLDLPDFNSLYAFGNLDLSELKDVTFQFNHDFKIVLAPSEYTLKPAPNAKARFMKDQQMTNRYFSTIARHNGDKSYEEGNTVIFGEILFRHYYVSMETRMEEREDGSVPAHRAVHLYRKTTEQKQCEVV